MIIYLCNYLSLTGTINDILEFSVTKGIGMISGCASSCTWRFCFACSDFVVQIGFGVRSMIIKCDFLSWSLFVVILVIIMNHDRGNQSDNGRHDVHGCCDNHGDSYHMTSHRSLPLSLDLTLGLQNDVNSTNGVHLERSWQSMWA